MDGDPVGCIETGLYDGDAAALGRRAEIDQGKRAGVTSSDAERISQLERENRELRKVNEILKVASAFFAQAELDRRTKS
jgi:transposase-like protein